jgi:hypothetical protein
MDPIRQEVTQSKSLIARFETKELRDTFVLRIEIIESAPRVHKLDVGDDVAAQLVEAADKDVTWPAAFHVGRSTHESLLVPLVLNPDKAWLGGVGRKEDAAIVVRTRPRLLETEGIAHEPVRRPVFLLTLLRAVAGVATVRALL